MSSRNQRRIHGLGAAMVATVATCTACSSAEPAPERIAVIVDVSSSVAAVDDNGVTMARELRHLYMKALETSGSLDIFVTGSSSASGWSQQTISLEPPADVAASDARLRIWRTEQVQEHAADLARLGDDAGGSPTDLLTPIFEASRVLSTVEGTPSLVILSDMIQTAGDEAFRAGDLLTCDDQLLIDSNTDSDVGLANVAVTVIHLQDGLSEVPPATRSCVERIWSEYLINAGATIDQFSTRGTS